MLETRPRLTVSLILLAALLAMAVVQSALAADGAFPTLQLYLAAHAFCYVLLITAHDLRSWPSRLAVTGSFAGAVMAAVKAMEILAGLMMVNSRLIDILAIAPLFIIVLPVLLVVASVGIGLVYGLSVAGGRVIWFPDRSGPFFPGVILHVLWAMAACFAMAVSTLIATGSSLHGGGAGLGFNIASATVLWLVSLPHLVLAWRADRLPPWDDSDESTETPLILHRLGLAAAVAFVGLSLWSMKGPFLSAMSGSVEATRIGDRTYFVPSSLIKKKHLDNLGALERRWMYIRMPIGGSQDDTGLSATSFNVYVIEEEARGSATWVETMNCARNLFGTMSGCWTEDAMDWAGHYPFPRPEPEFTVEFSPPHVVSRIDIVVLDSRRRYQALLNGLGQVYLDDGRALWRFGVPDDSLSQLDKIIVAAREFQERLKQEHRASVGGD